MRDTTWQLVDWWAELKRSNVPTSDIDKLNTQTHCAPWSDRKQRVIEARMAIKAALANNYPQTPNPKPQTPNPKNFFNLAN